MPILFHMSPQEGYEYGIVDEPGLPMLEEALEKYPGLKFIGHSQPFWHEISQDAKPDLKSRMEWGRGPVREGGRLVCLMRNYKNLYADLSANSGGCAIMRDEKFGLQFFGGISGSSDVRYRYGKYGYGISIWENGWTDSIRKENYLHRPTGKFVLRMPKRYFSYKRKGEK